MKYANFVVKFLCFGVILGALWQYQLVAQERAAEVAAHEAVIAKIEEQNEAVLRTMAETSGQESESRYADGVYEGTGTGFGGAVTVSVTVKEGAIKEIQVLSAAGEDPAYYDLAKSVLKSIVDAQSVEVDTVSGATYSSRGLMEATEQALEKAVK